MLSKSQRKEIDQLARDAWSLGKYFELGTDVLTPLNYHEEKKKFLSSNTYNPRYTYITKKLPSINRPLLELRHRLNKSKLPMDIQLYFHEYLNDLKVHELTIKAVGTDDFPYYAAKSFDWNMDTLSAIEKKLPQVIIKDTNEDPLLSAEEIKKIFLIHMAKIGIDDHVVEIDSFNDHIIRIGHKKIIIGSAVRRSKSNVKRLTVHEVDSHIMQRYNTLQAKDPLLRILKLYEQRLYVEGIAVYNEVCTKTITETAFETYWNRIKAVTLLQKSFREIYTELTENLSPEKAFFVTYRVKRGMGDTSLAGGFPKDACYLFGLEKINEFIREGGDITDLYLTRVPSLTKLAHQHELVDFTKHKLPEFVKKSKR